MKKPTKPLLKNSVSSVVSPQRARRPRTAPVAIAEAPISKQSVVKEPVISFGEQRVALLVDIQNLYYSARVLYAKKVNFSTILEKATGGRKMIRAFAYGISTTEGMEEKFFEALEKAGYEVKTKDLQIFPGGAKKGDWDVGIAVDAIKLAHRVDVIVLASGDGDFVPLVRYIQSSTACRVEGISFEESTSGALIESLDGFTNLSADKGHTLIG